jgi:signal transduction histidine kinase
LQDLCETHEERYSSTVQFSTRNIPEHIPEPISVALYRIVQEGMQNIAKHSQAKSINIALIGGTAALELTLRDSGVGFDTQQHRPGSGIGLISMAQRAKLAGGSFEIQSHPGRGTRIHVSVPLTRDELQDTAVNKANTVKSY